MSHYRVLRVFCGEDGSEGNPLAVFVAGRPEWPPRYVEIGGSTVLDDTRMLSTS